jgi:hypothetical protein
MDSQAQIDISKLSASDRKELNQFLTNEAQKSNIQQSELFFLFLSFSIFQSLPKNPQSLVLYAQLPP